MDLFLRDGRLQPAIAVAGELTCGIRESDALAAPPVLEVDSGMVILAGSVRLGAGKRVAALEPMRAMVEATRAEPGCLEYAFAFDLHDDHVLRIFEVFKDEAALAHHRNSEHMARWRALAAELGISGRDMAQYDASNRRQI